jgi:[ribosomal protein S18]-alanine N-acetyltransferase
MRPVTTDDADALAQLDALLFPENCFNETTLANEVRLGKGWCIDSKDRLVPLAAYALVRDDGYVLDLLRLGVHAAFQRRGLGRLLLERVLQEERPTMLTVRANNATALRLYLKHGFQLTGRLVNGAGWTMLRPAT